MAENEITPAITRRVAEIIAGKDQIAFLVVSPLLKVRSASPNLGLLFPRPIQNVEGQPLLKVVWELNGFEEAIDRVLQGKLPAIQIDNIHWKLSDEETHYFNLGLFPLDPAQPGDGLLFIMQENRRTSEYQLPLVQDRNELRLTKRKLAFANQKLEQLNRLKSLFLSMAAHDLRSPLSAVLAYTQLIKMKLEDREVVDVDRFLAIIIEQSHHMNHLIGDMLDLDQLEHGQLKIRITEIDLSALLRETSLLMDSMATRQELNLHLEIPDEPVLIQADPEKVRQIFYNLFSNAIKYTQEGGEIWVSAFAEGGWGKFQVKDTGMGMTEQDRARLFQLYYRTPEAENSSVSGTGLGLFIVRSLLEAMSGKIRVESEAGVGSMFEVSLPLSSKSKDHGNRRKENTAGR
jgi:signal transduction histidine kinase